MRTEVINTLREIAMGPSDVILLNENGSARCSAKIRILVYIKHKNNFVRVCLGASLVRIVLS